MSCRLKNHLSSFKVVGRMVYKLTKWLNLVKTWFVSRMNSLQLDKWLYKQLNINPLQNPVHRCSNKKAQP